MGCSTCLHALEQPDPPEDHVAISQRTACTRFLRGQLCGLVGSQGVLPATSPPGEQAWAREAKYASAAGSNHGLEKPPGRVGWHWSRQSSWGEAIENTCRAPPM